MRLTSRDVRLSQAYDLEMANETGASACMHLEAFHLLAGMR